MKKFSSFLAFFLIHVYAQSVTWYNLKDNVFHISNLEQLKELQTLVDSGNDDFSRKTVKLTADITINGNWTPIGNEYAFNGIFDGNNHTISGLSVDGNHRYAGLFGRIGKGQVKNITVKASKIKATKSAGVLAGDYDSSKPIENCRVIADSVIAISFDSDISSGGLVGSGGTINISNSYAIVGGIKAEGEGRKVCSGGLFGCGMGASVEILNSYAKGNVLSIGDAAFSGGLVGKGGTIKIVQSYSTVNVKAIAKQNIGGSRGEFSSYTGGLIGYTKSDFTEIKYSYSDGTVTALRYKEREYSINEPHKYNPNDKSEYILVTDKKGNKRWYKINNIKYYKPFIDGIEYYIDNGNDNGFGTMGAYAGGIFGYTEQKKRNVSVYYNSTVVQNPSGFGKSLGIFAKSMNELKMKETFIDWDFNNVWDITEGASTPFLKNNTPQL